jgi:DNA-binding NtrC family response regulator
VIERAVALATHTILSADDLPPEIRSNGSDGVEQANSLPGTLSALRRERVLAVLDSTQGNKEQAARILGISRRTLYRLLDRYGLTKSQRQLNGDAFGTTPSDPLASL